MRETSSPLRISIWKRFIHNRSLIDSGETDMRQMLDLDNLQEEVYSWQTPENPFDGIADESTRAELRKMLIDDLNVSKPPSQRGVQILSEFVSASRAAIMAEKVEWTVSQGMSENEEDFEGHLNTLLSFTLHLNWLVECFSDRPGISVSVR